MRLPDFFDKAANATPDAPAVWFEGTGTTYRELQRRSLRLAAALAAEELPPRARVASWLPNHPAVFVVQLAVHRLPLQSLPLNPRGTLDEVVDVMVAFGAEWLFLHASFGAHLPTIRERVSGLRGVVLVGAEAEGAPALERWTERFEAAPIDHDIAPEDVVTILTTGGSTGLPKGVERVSRNWATLICNYRLALPCGEPPINLAVTPLTHVAGDVALAVFAAGGLNVILPKPAPLAIAKAITAHRISHVFLPPTLLYLMLAEPGIRDFDYGSLRFLMYGAAPISVEKLREAWSVFGPVMTQLYGLMEATSTVSIMSPAEHAAALEGEPDRFGSIGRGSPLTMIDLRGEDGGPVGPGETAEVVCRGPNLFSGYVDNPEATAAALRDGWFRTGDLGVRDPDGYVRLVDRSKDIIITGGFNVFPGEVEQVIWCHPAVQDCAVIGTPDDKWGEAVTAVIELKPGLSVEADELIATCKRQLGSIKAPKRVIVWPELPRSSVGKVLKKTIRAAFWTDRQL